MKIRLLSYNIHKGFDHLGLKFVLRELKQGLQEINADIVLLQEVVGENQIFSKKIAAWPQQSQFEFLADSLWPHYSYGKNAIFPLKHHGNAILSKYPIVAENNLSLTIHKFEQRGILYAKIDCVNSAKKIHVFNTHLDLLGFNRKKQIQKLTNWMADFIEPDDAVLLGGDFNDWPQELSHILTKNLGLNECFAMATKKYAKTFPSFLPFLCLDRVYAKNIKVHTAKVIREKHLNHLSDHLPLMIEFSADV